MKGMGSGHFIDHCAYFACSSLHRLKEQKEVRTGFSRFIRYGTIKDSEFQRFQKCIS